MGILQAVLTGPFRMVVFIVGFLLVIVSCFNVTDLSKFQVSPHAPIYVVFIPGLMLLLGPAIHYFWVENDWGGWIHPLKVAKTEKGYEVPLGRSCLRVGYGRIQDAKASESASAVVLPANEFFDDECIHDDRSVLRVAAGMFRLDSKS